MEVTYKITEQSTESIKKFPWINSEFTLGQIESRSAYELVRLLENTHYPRIRATLEQIDKYGAVSGEIGESILTCNDCFVFSRYLAELSLFVYLYDRLGKQVIPIKRVENQKSPDISVTLEEYEYLIEVYSPIDEYGYQVFSRLLSSSIKNIPIDKGFNLSIISETKNTGYVYDFPDFRQVFHWFDEFIDNFSQWLKGAKAGAVYKTVSPTITVNIRIEVKSLTEDPDERMISWTEAPRSTDSITYFRIDDPESFAKTQWATKIKDKLQRQQAGVSRENVLRILAINLSLVESSDLSFLNDQQIQANYDRNIKYIAAQINPFPPYDIVLPCELSFDCGFSKPIILLHESEEKILELLSKLHLDVPIKKIPEATVEEQQRLIKEMIEYSRKKEKK